MHSKNNNKSQTFIQGLRPFSSSIPKTLKKHLRKGGYNYSNIVDNWTKMVSKKIADACYPLLSRNLSSLLSGDYKKNQQNEEEATYCRKLTKSDGCLDFNLTAEELACRSRAFSDWPGSFFLHEGSILRVGKMVRVSNYQKLKPGERRGGNQKSLIIGTGEGAVEILELQRPGAKMLPIQDFLRGYSLPNEIIFSSSRDQQELIRC